MTDQPYELAKKAAEAIIADVSTNILNDVSPEVFEKNLKVAWTLYSLWYSNMNQSASAQRAKESAQRTADAVEEMRQSSDGLKKQVQELIDCAKRDMGDGDDWKKSDE